MKVAVASNDEVHVAGHIGRVQGFLIYDISESKICDKNYIENTFTNHTREDQKNHEHHHGEGHQHGHERLIKALTGVSALIFQSGGWRLVEDLKSNGITPILTDESKSDTAVEKYLKGELIEKEENICSHHK